MAVVASRIDPRQAPATRRAAARARKVGCAAIVVAFGGCAIQQLNQDIDASQGRIADKQGEFDALQRTQAQLAADRDRLQADLRTRQLSAAELRTRLDELRRRNDAAATTTPQQRAQQADRTRQLDDAARRAQALDADDSLSQQEKARRLEALKAQTRNMLNLLLVG